MTQYGKYDNGKLGDDMMYTPNDAAEKIMQWIRPQIPINDSVLEPLRSGWLVQGPKVNEFEGEFSYQLIKNIWKNTFDQYYKINNKLMITEDHFIICKRNAQNII